MQTTIEQLSSAVASTIFDSANFKTVIEDHLTWLIVHPGTTSVPVTANLIEVYDFDWIGLLNTLRVPIDLHWVVIRMNGGMSLTDVPSTLRSILVPSIDIIQNLIMLNQSKKRVT